MFRDCAAFYACAREAGKDRGGCPNHSRENHSQEEATQILQNAECLKTTHILLLKGITTTTTTTTTTSNNNNNGINTNTNKWLY